MTLSQARIFYRLISHHQRLHARRHPMFEKNNFVRVFSYIFIAFWAVYLMMLGFFVYEMFSQSALEAFDVVDGYMIFLLALDFFLRFGMQETPAQDVHSYKLMPIPIRFLLDVFLVRMGLSLYNFFWAFFLVPFGVLAVVRFYGVVGLLSYLLGWWLLFVINSMWYLICRTFVNRNVYFLIVPILIYALLIYMGLFYDPSNAWLFDAGVWIGRLFVERNPLMYLLSFSLIIPLYAVNRRLQYISVYTEISKKEQVRRYKTQHYVLLNCLGTIGEYLKIEIRSIIRNSVVRKQFLSGFYCMLAFCVIFAFTGVYDDLPMMKIYICVYCFSCLSIMTLTVVLCAEGNYIDGLMSRKESILSLLKAKYYFNCTLMLVPFIITLFPVFKGKLTISETLGCAFFTSGVVMPFLFQLAAYNDASINLNARITKSGRSTKTQIIFSSCALFFPMFVMYTMVTLLGEDLAALCMISIGIIGTILHPLWLRNIYHRFMHRRYTIMDGFRNSR